MKPEISIVMPTYNVEKYFRQCIESVINQTLTKIEIIPVDDGSPDNCGAIMDEYAAKDPRIKPIHQENGGYGKAVNAGIAAATGEYIGIVETDDWCEPDMYEKLYIQAKKFDADVCKCGFFKYNSHAAAGLQNVAWKSDLQNIENYPVDRSFNISEFPSLFIMHASIWATIYKKDFLTGHNIKVNATRSASYQDFPFMTEVLCKAGKIAVVPNYLYHWRVEYNQNSSTNQCGKRLLIMPEQCKEVKRIIKENNLYNILKEEMYLHFLYANYAFFYNIKREYRHEYFNKFRDLFLETDSDKSFTGKYFNSSQKVFVKKLLAGNYFSLTWKSIRRSIIQFRWNRHERLIKIAGKVLYQHAASSD